MTDVESRIRAALESCGLAVRAIYIAPQESCSVEGSNKARWTTLAVEIKIRGANRITHMFHVKQGEGEGNV